jgi:ABC-type polysaccharide/polyol phosphate export permease
MTITAASSATPEISPSEVPAHPFRPAQVIERTRSGMPRIGPYLGEIWQRRPFVWHLARTQLKAENYDTAAGQLWIILNPLFMAAVYLMVRNVLRPGNSEDPQGDIARLIMGVFIFKFASQSLGLGARSIYSNRQMVLNTAFPRMIFPIASTTQAFMELIPTMAVFLLIDWYLGQPFTAAMIWLPVYLVTLTFFGLGIALLFAPLCVLWRDTLGMVPYITKCWLFLSPVMYAVSEIPPKYLPYFEKFNPAFPWFAGLEQIFDGQMPSMQYFWMTLAWMSLFLAVGFVFFLSKERQFAARL